MNDKIDLVVIQENLRIFQKMQENDGGEKKVKLTKAEKRKQLKAKKRDAEKLEEFINANRESHAATNHLG